MKAATESPIVTACLEYLTLRRVCAWRSNNVAVYDPKIRRYRKFRGRRGVSDILGILRGGRFLAVECKRPGEKRSPDQIQFLDDVASNGGVAIVAHGVDELHREIEPYLT